MSLNSGSERASTGGTPVFLVGARRSGSTLMRVMLNAHPGICFPRHFEIELAVRFAGAGPGLPTGLQPYYDALESTYEFVHKGHVIDRSLGFRELADSFLQQSLDASKKRFVMAAVHDDFDRLIRIWPEARFVYLVRDGRDVARSRINLGWDGNYWTAGAPWLVAEEQWQRVRRAVPPERQHELRFEDLVNDTESELTRVCEFIGTDYDAAIFDYASQTTYDRPDPRLVQQWRVKLSQEETQLAEARIRQGLTARGYELSDSPPLEVTPPMARRYERQTRWARRRADIDRYGLPLYLQDVLSRRLGARGWQKRIHLAMDTVRQDELQ